MSIYDSDDDDVPLTSLKHQVNVEDSDDDKPITSFKIKKEDKMDVDVEENDNLPLTTLKRKKTNGVKKEKKIKVESDSEDDIPLTEVKKKSPKKKRNVKVESDSDDDVPLTSLKKKSTKSPKKQSTKSAKTSKKTTPTKKKSKKSRSAPGSATKGVKQETELQKKRRIKQEQEEDERYKWWDDNAPKVILEEGQRWKSLWHNTPLLAPEYTPFPKKVQLKYDGKPMALTVASEEVASFYAAMINTDYASKDVFIKNFFKDWRDTMTKEEKAVIKDFKKCDFSLMAKYYDKQREIKKAYTKEEKLAIKAGKEKEQEQHGFAIVDGHKEKVGNFRIEPPGLFRGRGEHPKMGMVKRRVLAKEITINIGKGEKPPAPPAGQKWKEIQHDDKVTWLAQWTENVQGSIKYVMLNANSRMKGENDMKKYDKARDLKKYIKKIRGTYTGNLKNKSMEIRQRATALYFIDKLALRAGNEKNTEEEADTVGCCSLRFEHVEVVETKNDDGKTNYQIVFDFLGKDSIRYHNTVDVPVQVGKNVKIFKKGKEDGDELFDRLTVSQLNKHLTSLMPGLTAKVFRTYNASITLQQELDKFDETINKKTSIHEKVAGYNTANREVALLCNHQRAAPKSFDESMQKMKDKKKEWAKELKMIKKEKKEAKDPSKLDKKIKMLSERIKKKDIEINTKELNKTVALGTSKINYMDPRVTIAWCKRNDVPWEKCFSKTHREKFLWAKSVPADFSW